MCIATLFTYYEIEKRFSFAISNFYFAVFYDLNQVNPLIV